jgi:hypothetical protein
MGLDHAISKSPILNLAYSRLRHWLHIILALYKESYKS